MNIIEAEDMVKGLPDQVLFQEAQFPSGRIPQFLAVSEVQRRQDMRQRFQAQSQGQQPTVKDQILQGGIGATGMAPQMSSAPPMAPPAPPMPQGAPVGMAKGGSVPAETGRFFGGFGPESVPTSDALSRRYGSENPGVQNFVNPFLTLPNAIKFLKNPDAEEFSDAIAASIAQQADARASLNRGIRAPEGGAYGGGTGGGLTYGGPTSYSGQSYLNDLINQFSNDRRGVVSIEELPETKGYVSVEEVPTGMAVGGIVAPAINQAVNSLSSAGNQTSQSSQPSTGPSRETVIRKVKSLIAQGREMDALVLLRQAGINPSEVNMANGGMTPGGIVYKADGRQLPSDPGAVMFANMMGRVPEAFSAIRRLMPAPPGVSMADLEKFRPTREQYFDPEAERRRAELLARLEQMGTSRKAEDIAAAERYLKEAETPIQAAQDEARQAAIASTLMRLGAGVAAGKPEEGLAAAAQGVEQTMGRAREVAAAERRAARQDYRTAEREAVRAQRAAADQAFMMQAQNITNDENRQRDLVRDQMQFAQWAFGLELEGGKNRQQAYNNALQLSIGLSQAIDERLQAAVREDRLDKRNYETIFSSTLKEVIAKSESIDWGKDPETGDSIEPSLEQIATESAKIVDSILAKRGITNPSVSTTVTHNGQTFKFPTKEDADKFRAAVGAK